MVVQRSVGLCKALTDLTVSGAVAPSSSFSPESSDNPPQILQPPSSQSPSNESLTLFWERRGLVDEVMEQMVKQELLWPEWVNHDEIDLLQLKTAIRAL